MIIGKSYADSNFKCTLDLARPRQRRNEEDETGAARKYRPALPHSGGGLQPIGDVASEIRLRNSKTVRSREKRHKVAVMIHVSGKDLAGEFTTAKNKKVGNPGVLFFPKHPEFGQLLSQQ